MSNRIQSALRSDGVNNIRHSLRVGDNCPVCFKRIRKNDGFKEREKAPRRRKEAPDAK